MPGALQNGPGEDSSRAGMSHKPGHLTVRVCSSWNYAAYNKGMERCSAAHRVGQQESRREDRSELCVFQGESGKGRRAALAAGGPAGGAACQPDLPAAKQKALADARLQGSAARGGHLGENWLPACCRSRSSGSWRHSLKYAGGGGTPLCSCAVRCGCQAAANTQVLAGRRAWRGGRVPWPSI